MLNCKHRKSHFCLDIVCYPIKLLTFIFGSYCTERGIKQNHSCVQNDFLLEMHTLHLFEAYVTFISPSKKCLIVVKRMFCRITKLTYLSDDISKNKVSNDSEHLGCVRRGSPTTEVVLLRLCAVIHHPYSVTIGMIAPNNGISSTITLS